MLWANYGALVVLVWALAGQPWTGHASMESRLLASTWTRAFHPGSRAMKQLSYILLLPLTVNMAYSQAQLLGKFQPGRDLFLAHFNLKTDVDDLHAVAAIATMLSDGRFSEVDYYVVAGT
jgi:hypothetical protein